MPLFERTDKSEVLLHAMQPVFRRGVRLEQDTIRRLRDILMCQLDALGMDPEDISKVFRIGVTPRAVRNRLEETPSSFRSLIAKLCHEVMKMERLKHAMEPRRPEGVAAAAHRLHGVSRRPRSRVQRSFLFELEEIDGR